MRETDLDLSGLKCPLPVFRTRKALGRLAPGDLLVVTCTDPLAAIDIPNLVRETGDRLESQSRAAGALIFRLRKLSGEAGKRKGPARAGPSEPIGPGTEPIRDS